MIDKERLDPAFGQRGGITRIIPEDLDRIAVIAVEAVVAPDPDEALMILNGGGDKIA